MDFLTRLLELARKAYASYACNEIEVPAIADQFSNIEYIDLMEDTLLCLRQRYGIKIFSNRRNDLHEFALRLAAIQVAVRDRQVTVTYLKRSVSAN